METKNYNTTSVYLESLLLSLATVGAAIITAAGITGCSNSKSGTTTVTTGIKMTSSASAATVAKYKRNSFLNALFPQAIALVPASIVDSTGATVSLSAAWLSVEQIEFEQTETRDGSEQDGAEVEFKGPYAVDLLAAHPVILETATLPDLPYRRIKMKLHKAENGLMGAPSQLTTNSIYIAGTVGTRSFSYQSPDTTEYEIGGPNPILPKDGIDLLLSINLANVFKQINLSGVPNGAAIAQNNRYPGSNLCPSVNASAVDVYSCIRSALQLHGNFGNDDAGNGDLDSSSEKVK